jgi:hypothetical protein
MSEYRKIVKRGQIYTPKLEIKDTTDATRPASYLVLHLKINSEVRLKNISTTKEMVSISPL